MPPLRRTAAIALAMLLILAFAAPALAKGPGGNSSASAACENGGYLNWTRDNGTAFKNEGECTKYAAKGGTLVAVVLVEPYLEWTPEVIGGVIFIGLLTGEGLQPGATLYYLYSTISSVDTVTTASGTVAADGTVAVGFSGSTCGVLDYFAWETLDRNGATLRLEVDPNPCD